MNGVFAGKSNLAGNLENSRFLPHRCRLDQQYVVRLELEICPRLAVPYRAKVDGNQLGLARTTVDDRIARQFRLATVSSVFQAAAGAYQVADMHVRFQRKMPRSLDRAVDADDLFRPIRRRLQLERSNDRDQDALAARRQIKDEDLVTRTQLRIRRGATRRKRALEIRGNDLDSLLGRDLAPNHDVMRIGVRSDFVEAIQDIAEPHARSVLEGARTEHIPGQGDGILQRR